MALNSKSSGVLASYLGCLLPRAQVHPQLFYVIEKGSLNRFTTMVIFLELDNLFAFEPAREYFVAHYIRVLIVSDRTVEF